MLETLQGIMLRHIKYGETSVIADIFTPTHGIKSFMVQGVRKVGSKIPASIFQPLILLELVSRVHPKNLSYINEVRVVNPLSGIFFDVRKSALALFMVEVVHKTMTDASDQEACFDWLYYFATQLNAQTEPKLFFAQLFLAKIIQLLGSSPNIETYQEGCIFDPQNGGFILLNASVSENDAKLAESIYTLFKHVENISEAQFFDFDAALLPTRKIVLETLLHYMAWHVPNMKEINSHKVYQDIWA